MNSADDTPLATCSKKLDKIFLVDLKEIEGRIDPQYYFSKNRLELVKNTIYPVKRFNQVLDLQRGKFGHRPRNDPDFYEGDYPFIQTGDIVRAYLTNSEISFSQSLNEKGLATSRLFQERVVVFTIAANIGYTAILDYPACFPDSLIAIRPKNDDLLLDYINIYLRIIREYIESLAPQAAQKNINYQQLSVLPFIVPKLDVQKKIIEVQEDSLHLYKQKKTKSNSLLSGIDSYLLDQLGITKPTVDRSLSERFFNVQFRDLQDTYDPTFFFNTKYETVEGSYENIYLSDVTSFNKGTSITSSKIEAGDYPVIAGGKTSPYSHSNYNFSEETITVSASGAYSGYVWYHNYPIFASDCIVLTINPTNRCSTKYLYEILRLKQDEIYRLQRGAGQPHVYTRDLKKIKVPMPPAEKQEEIVLHINNIRQQASQLALEAEEILYASRRRIEDMILGK